MPNVGLRAFLWQQKSFEQRSQRQLWSGNGGTTYEGYREYIMQVTEQGFPDPPAVAGAPAPTQSAARGQPRSLSEVSEIVIAESSPRQLTAGSEFEEVDLRTSDTDLAASREATAEHEAEARSPPAEELGQASTSAPTSPLAAPATATALHTDYRQLHTFQVTDLPLSLVKFARMSSDLLAFGGLDGAVYLACASDPPRLLHVLERHTGRLTDLDWSHDNQHLLSCSDDGTVCLWLVETGALVRVFRNAAGAVLSCRFHLVNPSILFVGTAFGEVLVLNSSTGHMISKVVLRPTSMSGVGAACLELAPNLLLVADTCSTVHLYRCRLHGGVLAPMQLLNRTASSHGEVHDVACLEFVPHSALARGPAVLVVDSASLVTLFRLRERQRKQWLELKATARRLQASIKVRASLCPTASADHPEALLMGGEDGLVHVLDASRWSRRGEQLPVVAELAGHAAPVADVAWSYDESLLASCDRAGKVVLWHRVEPSDAFFSDSFEV